MTWKLGSGQILDIEKVKIEVVKIKKMVSELYDRPFISALMVTKVEPKIHVENIWEILKPKKEGR